VNGRLGEVQEKDQDHMWAGGGCLCRRKERKNKGTQGETIKKNGRHQCVQENRSSLEGFAWVCREKYNQGRAGFSKGRPSWDKAVEKKNRCKR